MSQANATNKTILFTHAESADVSVTIRRAGVRDERTVARLSRLDSRGMLPGPWLLAEVDGQPVAALSLSSGEVAADPFRHTQDLVDLLHARARHLRQPARLRRQRVTVFPARAQHLHGA